MNLFVEALANHIISTWDDGLKSEGASEVRFILQSLGPVETLSLFETLDAHAKKDYDPGTTGCFFRAATGLWNAWQEASGGADAAIQGLEAQGWIDKQDQLTKYRNLLAKDEGKASLVVVLVGLNHATDQGGLADFHVVDEQRIAQAFGGGGRPWIERIAERLGLTPSGGQVKNFDELLRTLSQLRPMQLGRLASFLEPMIQEGKCFDLDEFRTRVLQALPEWDIPPLLPDASGTMPSGNEVVKALKEAEAFISHVGYKTRAKQQRDLGKLEKAIKASDFTLPTRANGAKEFDNKNDYLNCLRVFIERADPDARERLLRVDAMPVVKALRRKGDGGGATSSKEKVKAFDDLSLFTFLQALWDALLDFEKSLANDEHIDELLGDMRITLVTLEHDCRDSGNDGGANAAAQKLLAGLLGGLEERLSEIAENLSERWQRQIAIGCEPDDGGLKVQPVRGSKRPSLLFRVSIADIDHTLRVEDKPYRWFLDATQPERVRHFCIEKTKRERKKLGVDGQRLLPAFRVGKVHLTALFYAADAEEGNRLVANAMQDMTLMDLLEGLREFGLVPELQSPLETFVERYWMWLDATLENGYYRALAQYEPPLRQAYADLCMKLLDTGLAGARDLLHRVYKAFLLVDDSVQPSDSYLAYCAAWGLSPAVLELSQAQTCFLRDYFPEALDELAERGVPYGKRVFERLLGLARMQRPVTALVKNSTGALTTRTRGMGLLHCVGEVESGAKSLAVQTLLKEEDESDDEEELTRMLRPCAEQRIVQRVLELYAELHDYAADGLRILAVNVADLSMILLGVEQYLKSVREDHPDYPPFECALMVYSSAASPLAMENRLSRWRERVMEACKEGERPLLLTVGHRYAPREKLAEQVSKERHGYDLAFLFHFLRADMEGKIEAAPAFDGSSDAASSIFPISEYPRPIQEDQPERREMLLSNRRLMVQTHHADLSARLHYQGDQAEHHLVLGQVSFNGWSESVKALHKQAQWVACIDPFVDKRLLGPRRSAAGEAVGSWRKIVGFESGVGDYGELNLTISTEQDTLERLMQRVAGELSVLLPHAPEAASSQTAARIVAHAEKIAGLSSLRAVLGEGEQIREVVGYGAIKRMLETGDVLISQLLPLDAMRNWIAAPGPQNEYRPDLLQLSLALTDEGMPHIQATVIECKVAARNQVHTAKALRQVRSGLFQLSRVLAPRCKLFAGLTFDRRYWWAQLQRAIASRSEVRLSADDWTRLNAALERVAEGQYLISWRGMVFTFWSDVAGPEPEVIAHQLTEQMVPTSVEVPDGFCIEQVVLGYQGLTNLFASSEVSEALKVEPTSPPICIRYNAVTTSPSREVAPPEDMMPPELAEPQDEEMPVDADQPSGDQATVAVQPQDGSLDGSRPAGSEPVVAKTGAVETQSVGQSDPGVAQTKDDARAVGTVDATDGGIAATPASGVPDRILIGTRTNGEPVYWYFGHPKLLNRHLLVFGNSGTGKTYGIQCLLGEMAVAGMRSLIVDYTDGFLPAQMEQRFQEVARPKSHFVITERLPINPFRRQRRSIDPSLPVIEENNYQIASRIASIFESVYAVGEQQRAALSRSLQKGLDMGASFSLDALLSLLRNDGSEGGTLASKIEPFVQAQPFRGASESAWEELLDAPDHGVHVLQLGGLSRKIQRMVTEFVLWDLWDYAQNAGNKDRPLPIVLDEIQNLDHRSDSPIDKMLREGRKFGVALMLATQTTSNFKAEQRDRLFQAGHKLFFKPADTEIDRFADILSKATSGVSRPDWADRLARLDKGQCWSLGPALQADGTFKQVATLVKVTALEQRF